MRERYTLIRITLEPSWESHLFPRKITKDPIVIKFCLSNGRTVHGLGTSSRVRASSTILPNPSIIPLIFRLEETIFSAYTLHLQTYFFSILPPSFSRGFKAFCAATLPPPESEHKQEKAHRTDEQGQSHPPSPPRTNCLVFETLGLPDRYESIIASVDYEHVRRVRNDGMSRYSRVERVYVG